MYLEGPNLTVFSEPDESTEEEEEEISKSNRPKKTMKAKSDVVL
jgi:hypothetical protein